MVKVKVFQKKVKLQGQGYAVKTYGIMLKGLSQEIHMFNMKVLSLHVRKLWPRLQFVKSRSKIHGKGHEVKNYGIMWKGLSQEIHMCNMKALSLLVKSYGQG